MVLFELANEKWLAFYERFIFGLVRCLLVCIVIWLALFNPSGRALAQNAGSGNLSPKDTVAVVTDGKFNAFGDVCLTQDNRLLAVYRTGSRFVGKDGVIKQQVSTDFGKTWGAATTIYQDKTPLDSRDISIVQLSDGRLGISFFKENGQPSNGALGVFVMFSNDYGRTWGTPIKVKTGFALDPFHVAVSGRIVERNDGVYLLPVYGKDSTSAPYYSRISYSTDKGATWSNLSTAAGDGSIGAIYSEHYVGYLSNGTTLLDLVRNDTDGNLYRTVSTDGGITWSTLTAITPFSNDQWKTSRPAWLLIPSGGIVLNYRCAGPALGQPSWAASWDKGATWKGTHAAFAHGGYAEYGGLCKLAQRLVGGLFPFEPAGFYTNGENGTRSDIYFQTMIDDSAPTPTPTPPGQQICGAVAFRFRGRPRSSGSLYLSCATSGAAIHYSLNGTAYQPYQDNNPIGINVGSIVDAYASAAGFINSPISEFRN